MNGYTHPLNCCGDDCCSRHGGIQCKECGFWFCTLHLDERGLCDDCAEIKDKRNNDNEE